MWTLATLYWPMLCLLLAVLAVFSVRAGGEAPKVRFAPLGLEVGEIDLPVESVGVARILLGLVALAALAFALLRDYSGYFPPHLQMDVYWDRSGIEEVVAELSDRQREELHDGLVA